MKKLLLQIKSIILESPGAKTFFNAIIPIVIGILSGTFVVEITIPAGLAWTSFYKSISFYLLLLIGIITYFYYKAVYLHEKCIEKFLDNDYCRAYMRSQCLPQAAERYRELIKKGEIGELTAAMKELERILK